jgi:transcriptional regulator with XRE-family HTH domain
MVHTQQKASGTEAKALRRKGGQYVKSLRVAAEMTQRELALKIGLDYYTFISQIENGQGRVPPDLYAAFADALEVDRREFVREILKFYDPFTYQILFTSEGVKRAC